jgi:hypothetical protein
MSSPPIIVGNTGYTREQALVEPYCLVECCLTQMFDTFWGGMGCSIVGSRTNMQKACKKLLMLDSKMESFVLKKVFKLFLHENTFCMPKQRMDKLISETEVSWNLHSRSHHFLGKFVERKSLHDKSAHQLDF